MPSKKTLSDARAAKSDVVRLLEGRTEVNGIGIAKLADGFAVKVNLSRPLLDRRLPRTVRGVPLKVEVIGRISRRAVPA